MLATFFWILCIVADKDRIGTWMPCRRPSGVGRLGSCGEEDPSSPLEIAFTT
jgi:hypothetical protein